MNRAAIETNMVPPILEIQGLSHSYAGANGKNPVLRGIDLDVEKGEFVAILGASGGGKSTLLNLIGGLERADEGTIRVKGSEISALDQAGLEGYRQNVAFIFQFFNLLPTLTALENVVLGIEAMDEPPPNAEEHARDYLAEVGLSEKTDRFPAQLSGGEQQRVAIARALARQAPLILADEPTGNLDEDTAEQVMRLFAKVQRRSRTTVVLITHDTTVAAKADRVLHLDHGRLVSGPAEVARCP